MKLSNYNLRLNLGDKHAIYNTISRKYVIYNQSQGEYIEDLLRNLKKDRYEVRDAEVLKKFISNGIIVEDELDEFERIGFHFNKTKYQDRRFILVISPTLDCNFRCPYCFEERRNTYISDETIQNLIEFVKKTSREVSTLQVGWFGGEPLLQFEKIKKMTETFKEICAENGCNYCSTITTNAYLFNDERINDLKEFNIKRVQITLDGDKEFHNKKRPLADGSGTFDRILENINKIVDKEIPVVLRINVDKENAESIPRLFDLIPQEKRGKIVINMCNIFQNEEDVNLIPLYKIAIEKGFSFNFVRKNYQICEGSFVNSITVQPDGKVTPCQMCSEKGFHFGKMGANGNLVITNQSDFYKFRYTSALDSNRCRQCNMFPICLGGCYYGRYKKNNDVCVGTDFRGIDLKELVKMEIYSDMKRNLIDEKNVI